MTPLRFSQADVELILDEMDRFVATRLHAVFQKHENVPDLEAVQGLLNELQVQGLLGGGEDAPRALWSDPDEPTGVYMSLQILRRLAGCSAGFAYRCHQIAVAAWLLDRLGLVTGRLKSLALISQGSLGLGQGALADWLGGRSEASLQDWLSPDQPIYFHTGEGWEQLLLPIWQADRVQWGLASRASLQVESVPAAPGFDEIGCFALRAPVRRSQTELSCRESREVLAEVLRMDALAMIAIASGSLRRARELAWSYARDRRQGGCKIVEHPAVSLMLADIDLALSATENWLEVAPDRPGVMDLRWVLAARASLHPACCQAADQAIQVHGGNGYMRDYGLEKVWREQQLLRRLGGTGMEIKLYLSQCERSA